MDQRKIPDFEVKTEKFNPQSFVRRPSMVFRSIPENSPNYSSWVELDEIIKSGNLSIAEKMLESLHGKLTSPKEKSLWFDRGARTLFLKGDYLGSVKAMQQSIRSAMDSKYQAE